MPESLQGKGQTISIGTLVAMVAALGGYQANQLGGSSIATQLAKLETKMENVEEKVDDIKAKLDKGDAWIKQMFELQATVTILSKRVETLEE